MSGLSAHQKRIKARTIVENTTLDRDLSQLSAKLDRLSSVKPVEVKRAIRKDELSELISAVKRGTADNTRIARFL